MKKIVSAGLMLATMTGAAFAADLPARTAPPVYAPPVPIFTWTGAYFGINAGYAFDHEGDFRTNLPAAFDTTETRQRVSSDGFTGGGQIGYNYQLGGLGGLGGFGGFGGPGGASIVIGVEADAAYTDLDRRRTVDYSNAAFDQTLFATTTSYRSSLDFLGTVRGRLGLAFGQFLVYGTGGFAYGGVNDRFVSSFDGATLAYGGRDRIETGYAYGGGIEYALPTSSFLNFFKSSAVTLKVEYLHYDLGKSNLAITQPQGAGTFPVNVRVSNEGDLVRAGLNYKFGSY